MDEAAPETASPHPPRAPFSLTVGITGHRYVIAGHEALDAAGVRLSALMADLEASAARVRSQHAAFFRDTPSRYRLVSPLADGTDQIAAEVAIRRGWRLETILPFERSEYVRDFCERTDRDRFSRLLQAAATTLELPGVRAGEVDAYAAVGRAVVAQSDIIVTIWNGKQAGGRGGTGEIVEHALRNGLPVIHVPIDRDEPVRILWAGFNDPPIEVLDFNDAPRRDCTEAELDQLLSALLAPPADGEERAFIQSFYAETQRSRRTRIEYPLLLGLLGAKRFSLSITQVADYHDSVAHDWAAFNAGRHQITGGHGRPFADLERAYAWVDGLANHYAMAYRSGHIANYVLASLAVVLALTGLLAHDYKFYLVIAELLVILGFSANTRVGNRCQWHRRWLDYRQAAEQLRIMRSLKLCAITRGRGSIHRASPGSWADWYAAAIWRDIGCPEGRICPDSVPKLAKLVASSELEPQVSYHHVNAHRMDHVEHRLHGIADLLFKLTVVSLVGFLVAYKTVDHLPHWVSALLVFISAGFPAIAGAFHGIREQGEFRRTGRRSTATANALEALATDLEHNPTSLSRVTSLVEEAARVMLEDVGEWRRAYEMRNLAIPA